MSSRPRRGVDESLDVHLDERLANPNGVGGHRGNFQSRTPTAGSTTAQGRHRSSGLDINDERADASSSAAAEVSTSSIGDASLVDASTTIRHVDPDNQILKILSLMNQPSRDQGTKPSIPKHKVYIFVVFISDIFGGSHPYRDWLNDKAPSGDNYLPAEAKAYLPLARTWAYGYQSSIDDQTPLASPANNFLVYYKEQRLRDSRNNPETNSSLLPKLIFVCTGLGGLVAKKSSSAIERSIVKSCQGIVFLSTPHGVKGRGLQMLSQAFKFYPRVLIEATGLAIPNMPLLMREVKVVNEEFGSELREMPPTFSVTNLHRNNHYWETVLPPGIRRHEKDEFLSVVEKGHVWRRLLHKDHPVFKTVMATIRGWTHTDEAITEPTETSVIREQISGCVNLLSIDGGGVRGLASLLVIDRIMREIIKKEIAEDPSTSRASRMPADYFNLAGGTSTGGLICIMLFRLRMDIQSTIVEYRRLAPVIFKTSMTQYLGANVIKTAIGKPWFDGTALENCVRKIVLERISWEEKEQLGEEVTEAPLSSGIESVRDTACNTFMCALKKEDNSAVRFRTYPPPDRTENPFPNCKMWEAARATSAAPFYFPTAIVRGVKFWDGGLANNNPVLEVLAEKSQLYPDRPVNCMISLGTGASERKPSKSMISVLGKGKQVLKNVTNVEINHARAKDQLRFDRVPYFRFNPSTADDEIGLADFNMLDALERHTDRYLDREDVKAMIAECAELLYHRSNDPLEQQPQQQQQQQQPLTPPEVAPAELETID